MGKLRPAQIRIIDQRFVDQDVELYDVRALTGYLDDTKKRSIRIHLTPFLYDYQLEHRNRPSWTGASWREW